MNMDWLMEKPILNLPWWSLILIGLVVLILLIVIIVVAVQSKKKAKNEQPAEPQPVKEATVEEEKVVVAGFKAEEPAAEPVKEEKVEEKPATPAVKEENVKVTETAKTQPKTTNAATAPKPATTAKPAEKKTVATTKPATTAKPATTTKPAAKPAPVPAEKTEKAEGKPKVYHISLRKVDGKWQVKAAGAAKALKLFDTQAEAIEYCKPLAENQDANIMIHKKDGSFRKLTY